MINPLIWILLLSIWNSILFFGTYLGISVILFIIPLLIFIYYTFKTNDKIKNKNGLLFMIPITLLSLTYFIFNNNFFQILNIPIITVLFILMYIYTMNPTYSWPTIIESIILLPLKPLDHIANIFRIINENLRGKIKLPNNTKKILKSILLIIPIVFIIIVLLSSADQIFENLFTNIFVILKSISIPDVISNLIKRLIPMLLVFFYIAATMNFLLYNYSMNKQPEKHSGIIADNLTIKLLLTVLNVIYIIFDIIQIKSLMLHQVSMDVTYAEYARQGFFQLMIVSFINLIIIFISKTVEEKEQLKSSKYIKVMNLIMVFLTFIIIISSFIRMNMYESEFGYTLLRLLVYITLITEVILLIPTIIYIINSKFNIVKYYIIIIVSIYILINFINVDHIIAYRNVERYYNKNDVDIYYLMNDKTDNIPILIELYNKTDDKNIKESLKNYFKDLDTKINSFQEFNISKYRAEKYLKEIK